MKIWLIAVVVFSLLNDIVINLYTNEYEGSLIRALIFSGVWYAYMCKSKRVKKKTSFKWIEKTTWQTHRPTIITANQII
jgi:hypothetical protein